MTTNYKEYDPTDYINKLKEASGAEKTAYDTLYDHNMKWLSDQRQPIDNMYQQASQNVYSNARLSALGNNERQADLGLAGNAYTQPKSGYSETSRIRQDTAMQGSLNSLREEERNAVQSLMKIMYDEKAKRQQTHSGIDIDLYRQVASEQSNAKQINEGREYEAYVEQKRKEESDKLALEQKERSYSSNYGALNYDFKQGIADLDYAKYQLDSDLITKEQYDEFEGSYKVNVKKKLDEAFALGDETSLQKVDEAFSKGTLTKEEREEYYGTLYERGLPSIKTQEDVAATLQEIEQYKDKMGQAYYDSNKALLLEKKMEISKQPKDIKQSGSVFDGLVASAKASKERQKADVKTYSAPSGNEYHIVDKNTQYGINSASVSLGEWLELKYPNGETDDLYVSLYASKKTKDYAKSKNVGIGELFEYNGRYYMRGANAYFRVTNVKESLFK